MRVVTAREQFANPLPAGRRSGTPDVPALIGRPRDGLD